MKLIAKRKAANKGLLIVVILGKLDILKGYSYEDKELDGVIWYQTGHCSELEEFCLSIENSTFYVENGNAH